MKINNIYFNAVNEMDNFIYFYIICLKGEIYYSTIGRKGKSTLNTEVKVYTL